MKTVIYKCDRCGEESTDAQKLTLQVVAIGIRRDNAGVYAGCSFNLTDHLYRQKEWCRGCCKELGIWRPEKLGEDGKADPAQYPTLEDLVREIVRDETKLYD